MKDSDKTPGQTTPVQPSLHRELARALFLTMLAMQWCVSETCLKASDVYWSKWNQEVYFRYRHECGDTRNPTIELEYIGKGRSLIKYAKITNITVTRKGDIGQFTADEQPRMRLEAGEGSTTVKFLRDFRIVAISNVIYLDAEGNEVDPANGKVKKKDK